MKISKNKKHEISNGMFGLFFEDINYAADGGLYAELIENRSFEAKKGFGNPGTFYTVDDFGYAWSSFSSSKEEPVMQFVSGSPLSVKNPHYLRFTATKAHQGFKNKAYDGICLKKGQSVNVVFYARAVKYEGDITISIGRKDENKATADIKIKSAIPFKCFSDLTVEFDDDDKKRIAIRAMDKTDMVPASTWVKYEASLELKDDVKGAEFMIELNNEGIIEFDYISVIPKDAIEGVFRKDLFETLKDMHPGFIRFPGGCIVEGISLLNRYQWKNTVGPNTDRTYMPNLWAFDDNGDNDNIDAQRVDNHYGQSFGIGFYEYFLLCEKVGAKPLPVLNMAAACQFRSTQMVDIDSDEFDKYIEDALDLIEFANGDTNTKWGKLRASMGHPESFNLELLAIGNEQWQTESFDVFARNDKFVNKINEKYPDIKILGTAGPVVDMPMTDIAWDYYRKNAKGNEKFCYAVDEHYYKSPEWMYKNVSLYDNYPEYPYVFAGEYAAHTKGRDNSMESALAEAALMTGLEINANVVKLASYAPLFNRIGHSQWRPDMIWFDEANVYLTPNYHVQGMFANHMGKYTLEFTDEQRKLRDEGIYVSTSISEDNKIILKIVNTNDSEYTLSLTDDDNNVINKLADVKTLTGSGVVPTDMPEKSAVTIEQTMIKDSIKLKAKSFTIIVY